MSFAAPLTPTLVLEQLEKRVYLSGSAGVDETALLSDQHAVSVGPEAVQTQVQRVVAIDAAIAAEGITVLNDPATRVVFLTGDDPLGQIGAALEGLRGVSAVHVITHGQSGALSLNGRLVDAVTLESAADELAGWSTALADDAAILLYGCEVGVGEKGSAFLTGLAKRTGATVAASDDPTGGNDWELEVVAGDAAEVQAVAGIESLVDLSRFGGLLAAPTVSANAAITHKVSTGPQALDAALTVTGAGTFNRIDVQFTGNYKTGEDVLSSSVPGGIQTFNATTGTLSITGLTANASTVQSILRGVKYENAQLPYATLGTRTATIKVDNVAVETVNVTPELVLDTAIRTRINEAAAMIDAIGDRIAGFSDSLADDSRMVPLIEESVGNLFYPKDSDGTARYTTTDQPNQIGKYLQIESAVSTYLSAQGINANVTALAAAIQSFIAGQMAGSNSTIDVSGVFTQPAENDQRRIDLTIKARNVRGDVRTLILPELQRDLSLTVTTAPSVQAGGGIDMDIRISLELDGHTYGGALPQSKVGLNFAKLSAVGGINAPSINAPIRLGIIGGTINGGSVRATAELPVTFTGGASKTLNSWVATQASGFGTLAGSVAADLPISASIQGVLATSAGTKLTISDDNIFAGNPVAYGTSQFGSLQYFAALTVDDIIRGIKDVGELYDALDTSSAQLLGLPVPLLDNTTFGSQFDLGQLFDITIGNKIDVVEPVLSMGRVDGLTDYRLPLSDDSTPKPAEWSDLRGAFSFGVVTDEDFVVRNVTVAADGTRSTLPDLVLDINVALAAAGIKVRAAGTEAMSFKATTTAVQWFALVPAASAAERVTPLPASTSLSSLPNNTPRYITVTGTTSGAVRGTNFYRLDSALGAAAVHAGLLADGETGVVKVTRKNGHSGFTGSNRNGITSGDEGGADAFLLESAEPDLVRLGVLPAGEAVTVLDSFTDGRIRATLPLSANLSGPATFVINNGSTDTTVTVADNNNATVEETLADVQLALINAGFSINDLTADLDEGRLVLTLPSGSSLTTFSVKPTSDVTAEQVLPLGFLVGGIAEQPRPAALQTIDDFANSALFNNLSITPVYNKAAGTVTFEFSVNDIPTRTAPVGIDFKTGPLTGIAPATEGQTVTPTVGRNLAFGVSFRIAPAEPIIIASKTAVNPVLSANANFDLDFVLQDKVAVTVPSAWTTGNAHIQELVGDINQALQQTVDLDGATVDLTDGKLIARHGLDDGQFELVTAFRTNGGTAIALSHTAGVLASDLSFNFTHDGQTYTVTLAAADTAGNTSMGQLVRQLNAALINVGPADLAQNVFFTTFSNASGAQVNEMYVYALDPPSVSWPTAMKLSATSTNAAVTAFGFDDGANGAASQIIGRTSVALPKIKAHSNGAAFAGGTLEVRDASFAGSANYGLNVLRFTGTDADIDAKVSLALPTPTALSEFTADLVSDFTRTVTGSNGTLKATAGLTLTGISRNDLAAVDDDIASNATVSIAITDLTQQTVVQPVIEGAPIAIPGQSAGKFKDTIAAHTLYFIHDDVRYGVTVDKADTQSNTNFTELVTQYNAALTSATRYDADGDVTVDVSGLFRLTKDPATTLIQLSVMQPVANPNFAATTFGPDIAAFGEAGLQGAFGLGIVAESLTDVLPVLDTIQRDLTLFKGFDVPLIDKPVRDVIDIKGDLLSGISRIENQSVSRVEDIAPAIATALNIPAANVALSFDASANAYRLDMTYDAATVAAESLSMTLADFYRFTDQEMPESLTNFNDTAQSSPLEVRVNATTKLSIGIDLTDPNAPRTFLYGFDGSAGTSVDVRLQAQAEDINFTAAAGAIGIFVRGGNVKLRGPANIENDEPVYTYNADKEQLSFDTADDAALLSATLGTAGGKFYITPQGEELGANNAANFVADFAGSIEANLPLFTPTEFIDPFADTDVDVQIKNQGTQTVELAGNVFTLLVPDLGDFAEASLLLEKYQTDIALVYGSAGDNPLNPTQQAQVDTLLTNIAGLTVGDLVTVFSPDVDAALDGQTVPTLLDAVRDPAILLDGIDVILGTVETGLRGLDSLNLPVIGGVLGDAVDGVFDFRSGWLEDLKHDLRGQGDAFFQSLKESVYDFLGPAGIDLLLKDNGISSVEGLQGADSVDDVVLDFFDADGNKLTGKGGYGADSFEFKVRLGQVLVDTGLDLSFDFDSLAPAFSIGIDGGLTFKLGWDLTLGFGFSLTDGFYVVTNSDDAYNEIQLQFEAGLSGAQTGFTVATRASSITGYSIKDANGLWVHGPADGNGVTRILDVMPVLSDGSDWSDSGSPTLPQDCAQEDAELGTNETPFWVVAVANGSGTAVPAYIDQLGTYRPQASRDPDRMVRFDQTAPFSAFGNLFFFNLAATDTIRTGLGALGNGDYFYDPSQASTTTPYGRGDADYGVNRNNHLPTRVAGRIGVNLVDPSTASGDYVARPGPSATGLILMDGSAPITGGEPVLDDEGNFIAVLLGEDGEWYYAVDEDGVLVAGDSINTDETPNRITFDEIREAGLELFELDISAEAVVNLAVEFFISENAAIPRLTATLNLDWRTDSVRVNPDGSEKRDFVPEIGINDIRLDLGSFLNKFIKPIAEEIDDAFRPIDPLINVVNSKIPVLSELAGRNVRITDLLTTFGGPKGKAIAAVIDTITLVRDLSAVMAAVPAGQNVYLPIGNFWLAKQPTGGMKIYYDNSEVRAPSITQRNQSLISDPDAGAQAATNALGKLDQLDRKEQAGNSNKFGASKDNGGFDIPILKDPTTIFRLLMGQDVPLVTFSLPSVDFQFDKRITLARILVLEIGLRINVNFKAQLHMGYDTKGIRLFADSRDPGDLLEGFYISDRQNADGSGRDVDEFALSATLALYGGIDVGLAKAGIEGGFTFNAAINLNDPDNDGKLRVLEAIELVEATGNPLDLADLSFSGEVYARYYYWVGLRVWTPWKTYTITLHRGGKTFARATIFSFTREGSDGPPVFASKVTTVDERGTETPNTLVLHMGATAEKRVSNQDPLKLQDGSERFTVWNSAGNPSTVHVRYNNYSNSETQTFTNVAKVVAHGGKGNDTIDLSGLQGIPVDVDGGAGNDTISLKAAPTGVQSTLAGGSGNDTISVTNGGNVRLDGGDGNDTLTGGSGTNDFRPGYGNDRVTGGGAGSFNTIHFARTFGVDQLLLNPAATANIVSFIQSTLPLNAKLEGDDSEISAGDANKATFDLLAVTEIHGSQGRDVFNITNPQTRNRADGQGLVIRGGVGDDQYNVVADDVSDIASQGIFIDDATPPTSVATAGTVELDDCGHIKRINVASSGSGYAKAPEVLITDPTGYGARAVASINDDGEVTGIYIIAKGDNYSATPTITLIDRVSRGDAVTFSTAGSGEVVLDRNVSINRLTIGGKPIRMAGYNAPGTPRNDATPGEIDDLSILMPNGSLRIATDIDIRQTLKVDAKHVEQAAGITADTVKITTAQGFQADHPIHATNNGDVLLRVTGQYPEAITEAAATATVADGVITGLNLTSGGSGYTHTPIVTIVDKYGSGARAQATLTNGVVTGLTLLDGGSGYFTTPAPKIVFSPQDSIRLDAHITSSTVGSLAGTGDGRGTITLRSEGGAIGQAGDVDFGSSNLGWKHGDFDYAWGEYDTLDDIAGGGSGATATAVVDTDGQVVAINVDNAGSGYSTEFLPSVQIEGGATATAIVDNSTGTITGFRITYPGDGYAQGNPPAVRIVANGFAKLSGPATNRAHIQAAGGSLIASAVTAIGDANKPLKTDVETMVAQTTALEAAIYVLEKDGTRLGLLDHINGLSTIDGDIAITNFTGDLALGQPVQAIDTSGNLIWQDAAQTIPVYERDENGRIVYRGGKISAGDGGIKFVADDIDVNSFVGAGGGTIELSPVRPDAEVGLNGTQATAEAIIENGVVTGFTNIWAGRGYKGEPLVTLTPPGQRAFGVSTVRDGQLQNIRVTFGGSNYNADFPPVVSLVGGNPDQVATVEATYNSDGQVTGFTVTNPGSGYDSAPEVRVSLPGQQATARAVFEGDRIVGLTLEAAGANYRVAPTVEIGDPYPFSLKEAELDYFQDGFEEIIIGRIDGSHTFHSANASFTDGIRLRAPRGGKINVERLVAAESPVVIVGSGHTLNLDSSTPYISGTFIEVDDNIIVHDDVDATLHATTGHISIFGAGKGKIDGVAGSDDENLTILDVGDITITGAIGSTYPINDLTLNSSGRGTVSIQRSIRLEGNLTITEAGNVSFGGDVTIEGDLIIEDADNVEFLGSLNVLGEIIINQAGRISFAQDLNIPGDITIGDDTDLSRIERVTFAANTLFNVGGTASIYTADDIRLALVEVDGDLNLATLDDITITGTVDVGGTLTLGVADRVSVAGDLEVTGDVSIGNSGDLSRVKELTFAGGADIRVDGALTIAVDGDIALENVDVANDIQILTNGALEVAGTIDTDANFTIGRAASISIDQDITVAGNALIGSDLDLTLVGPVALGATAALRTGGNAGIYANRNITTGALDITGNLLIAGNAGFSAASNVSVDGNFTLGSATAASFARDLGVIGFVSFGSSVHPTRLGAVSFASSARFDAAGIVTIYTNGDVVFGNRVGQLARPTSMLLRSQTGDISFNDTVSLGSSPLTIVNVRDLTFGQDLTAGDVLVTLSTNQIRFQRTAIVASLDITSATAVQAVNQLQVTTGATRIRTNEVAFNGGVNSILHTAPGTQPITIEPYSLNRAIAIGSPSGASGLDISDLDLDAISGTFSELVVGTPTLGTGIVTLGSIGTQQGAGNSRLNNSTRIYGGSVNVAQKVDSAAGEGYLKLVANTGNITVNAAINQTPGERNDVVELLAELGGIVINQEMFAGDEMRLYAANTITAGGNGRLDADKLAVDAGSNVVLLHAGNRVADAAFNLADAVLSFRNDNDYKITTVDGRVGLNVGTGDAHLISNNATVTQDQAITAADLRLDGTLGNFTLQLPTNDADTTQGVAHDVKLRDADDLNVTNTVASGVVNVVTDAALTVGTIDAVGNVALDAGTTLTSNDVSSDANIAATANGDFNSNRISALGSVQLDTPANMVLAETIAGTTVTLTVGDNLTNTTRISAGTDVVANVTNTMTSERITAGGTVTANAAVVDSNRITATGATVVTATGNLTADVTDAGNVDFTAGDAIVADDVTSGADVRLDAVSTVNSATRIKAVGNVYITTDTGSISTMLIEADNLDVDAATSYTSGTINTTGNVDLDANGTLDFTTIIAGGNVSIEAVDDITSGTIDAEGDLGIIAAAELDMTTTSADNADIDVEGAFTNGSFTTARNLTVDAESTLNSSRLTAGGDVDLDVLAALTSDTIDAEGDLTINGGSTVTLSTTAGRNVDIDAVATLTSTTLVATGTVDADATSIDSNRIDADGSVTLNATGAIDSNVLATDGDLNATAGTMLDLTTTHAVNANLTANGAITNGTLTATGNVDIDGGAAVVAGTMTIAGTADVDATTNLSAVNLNVAGNANLDAGNDINATRISTLANGVLNARRDMVLGDTLATGTLNVTAGRNVDATRFSSGGNFTANVTGSLDADRVLTNAKATVNAASLRSITSFASGGDSVITTSGNINTKLLTTGGKLTTNAGGTTTLTTTDATGPANIVSTGTVNSTTLTARAGLVLNTAANLNATTTNVTGLADIDTGAAMAFGTLTAGSIDADAVTTIDAITVTTTGKTDLLAGSHIDITTLNAGGLAKVQANGDVDVDTLTGGGIDLDSTADITLGTANSSAALNADAARAFAVTSLRGTTAVGINAGTTLDAGSITSNGNATMTSGGNFNVDSVNVGGTLDVNSAARITLDTTTTGVDTVLKSVGFIDLIDVNAGRDIRIVNEALGNARLNSSTLVAGRNVVVDFEGGPISNTTRVTAGNDIDITGGIGGNFKTVAANNNVALDLGGTPSGIELLTGKNIAASGNLAVTTANARGDLNLDGLQRGGNLTAAGNAKVVGLGNLETGSIEAANIDLDNNGSTTVSRLTATGDIDVDVLGKATLAAISAGRNINVDATQNVNNTTLNAAGNATIVSGRTLNLGTSTVAGTLDARANTVGLSNLTNAGTFKVTSVSDTVVLANIITGKDASLTAGTSMKLADGTALLAGGDVTLTAATMDMGTDVQADGTVRLNAATTLTSYVGINAGGAIGFTGSIDGVETLSIAAGKDIRFAGGVGENARLKRLMIVDAVNVIIDAPLLSQRFDQFGGSGTTYVNDTLSTTHSRGLQITTGDIVVDAAIGTRRKGTADLNALRGMAFTADARIWSHGGIELDAEAIEAAEGSVLAAANKGDFVIVSNRVNLPATANSVTGNGKLVVEPRSTDRTMKLGINRNGFGLATTSGLGEYFTGLKVTGADILIGDIEFDMPVEIVANGDLVVDGTLRNDNGGIQLVAGDRVEILGNLLAGTSGDIIVNAAQLQVGAKSRVARVAAPGSVLLGTRLANSSVVVANPLTRVAGYDILIGGINGTDPQSVRLAGNFTADDDFNVYAGTVFADSFRIVAHDSLNIDADGDITVRNGSAISRTQKIVFDADRNGNNKGTLNESMVFYNNPRNAKFRAQIKGINLDSGINKNGSVNVRVHNVGTSTAAAYTQVAIYASKDGVLDGSDVLLGWATGLIELAADTGKTINVKASLPVDLAAGNYHIIADVLSYDPSSDSVRNVAVSEVAVAA